MLGSCLSVVSLFRSYLRRTVTAAGLSSQTIDVDDKTTIHLWAPKLLNSGRPSLVLIHGFGPHGVWQWRPQIVFFSRYYDLYIPDLVFFGETSTTRSSERSEVFQAVTVGKVLEKLGVNKYSVMGTSYGGFVAYQMALMWPERVEKVVIASSGVNMRRRDNEGLMKRAKVENIDQVMLPSTPGQLKTLMGLAMFKRPYVPDFLMKDFLEKLYSENRKEKLELLQGLTIGRDDIVNLSPLQQEVLIVWGDHDQIFLLEKATELKELLGKNVKLEVIKNASHVPQLEHPVQFNNIVKSFLCGPS